MLVVVSVVPLLPSWWRRNSSDWSELPRIILTMVEADCRVSFLSILDLLEAIFKCYLYACHLLNLHRCLLLLYSFNRTVTAYLA